MYNILIWPPTNIFSCFFAEVFLRFLSFHVLGLSMFSFHFFRLQNMVYNTGTRWGLLPLYPSLGWDVGDMKCKDDLGMRAKRGWCASGCPCRPPVSGVGLQILYVVIKMFRVMIDYSIAARAGWNGFNDGGQTDDDNVFYCKYYILPKLLSI